MAAPSAGDAAARLVFRSRAVRIAGIVDLVLGIVALLAGVGMGLRGGNRNAIPLGLAIGVLGIIFILSGLGRVTARMVISRTHLTWTWSFSIHQLALEDLDDAALVEKGSPASGAAWAGFLGGGFAAVVVWWLFDVTWALFKSEPSLGSVELIAIKHYGGSISVKPIGAWSTRASHSEASQALQYLQTAIAASARRSPVTSELLLTDAWERPGED